MRGARLDTYAAATGAYPVLNAQLKTESTPSFATALPAHQKFSAWMNGASSKGDGRPPVPGHLWWTLLGAWLITAILGHFRTSLGLGKSSHD